MALPPPVGRPYTREDRAICEANWPDCVDDEYNPSCCRFPKRCSCGPIIPSTPENVEEPT